MLPETLGKALGNWPGRRFTQATVGRCAARTTTRSVPLSDAAGPARNG